MTTIIYWDKRKSSKYQITDNTFLLILSVQVIFWGSSEKHFRTFLLFRTLVYDHLLKCSFQDYPTYTLLIIITAKVKLLLTHLVLDQVQNIASVHWHAYKISILVQIPLNSSKNTGWELFGHQYVSSENLQNKFKNRMITVSKITVSKPEK